MQNKMAQGAHPTKLKESLIIFILVFCIEFHLDYFFFRFYFLFTVDFQKKKNKIYIFWRNQDSLPTKKDFCGHNSHNFSTILTNFFG
jgi:hypothetical protein